MFIITVEEKTKSSEYTELEKRIKDSLTNNNDPVFKLAKENMQIKSGSFEMPTGDKFTLTYHAAAYFDCIMVQAKSLQTYCKFRNCTQDSYKDDDATTAVFGKYYYKGERLI